MIIWMNVQIQKKNQFLIDPPIDNSNQTSPAESIPEQASGVTEEPEIIPENNDSFSPVPIEDLKNKWTTFLELVLKDHSNLGSFLSFASISSVSSDVVELKFSGDYRFQYMEVTKRHNQNEISRLLQEFVGHNVDLQISLDANAPRDEDTNYIKQIGNIPSTINDEIEKEPIIQTILDIFDGEILD